jgi:sugar/nucleoside kinase (ribokinase family)
MINYIAIGGITIDDTVIHSQKTVVEAPGGNSIYSALGARIWSDGVGIVSCIGPDYPDSYLKTLESGGLDLRGVQKVECPSQHLWLLYEEDGSRQFIFHKNSGITETGIEPIPGQIPADFLNAKMSHLSAMGFDLQQDMARFLKNNHLEYSYDITQASLGIEGKQYSESFATQNCKLLLPSIEELELVYGKQPLFPLLSQISEKGPKLIAVKMGSKGSIVFDADKNQTYHIPVFPVNVVDSTGAGDAYCGGFMVGFGETGSVREAGIYGTASASFAIQEYGALHLLQVDKKEALKRVEYLRKNVETVSTK